MNKNFNLFQLPNTRLLCSSGLDGNLLVGFAVEINSFFVAAYHQMDCKRIVADLNCWALLV